MIHLDVNKLSFDHDWAPVPCRFGMVARAGQAAHWLQGQFLQPLSVGTLQLLKLGLKESDLYTV